MASSDSDTAPIQDGQGYDAPTLHPIHSVVVKYLGSEHNIPSRYLQLFINLLDDPGFGRSLLDYHQPGDVYVRESSLRTSIAANRSRAAATLRGFPPTVIDAIVSHVEALKQPGDASPTLFRDENTHLARRSHLVTSTLESVSLVHPSWTWSAQKALGRELAVLTDSDIKLRKAATSPLYGSWTDRAVIVFERQASGPQWMMGNQTQTALEADEESTFLLRLLFRKVQHITSLTLALEFHRQTRNQCWESVFSSLASFTHLESLTFLHTWSGIPMSFGYRLSHLLGELPRLRSLSLDTYSHYLSGRMLGLSVQGEGYVESDLEDVPLSTNPRPAALTSVHLATGFKVSPDFTSWLLNGCNYDNDNDNGLPESHIHELSLATTSCMVARVTEVFDSVSFPNAFNALHTLTLDFMLMAIPEDLLTTFLRAVHANALFLRQLSISSPQRDIISIILVHLPSSLHKLTYSTQLADVVPRDSVYDDPVLAMPRMSTVLDFDLTLSMFLLSPNLRTLYPCLHTIDLRLEKSVFIGLWLRRDERQMMSSTGVPELKQVMAAAKQVDGLDVDVRWKAQDMSGLTWEERLRAGESTYAAPDTQEAWRQGDPDHNQNQIGHIDDDSIAMPGAFPLQLHRINNYNTQSDYDYSDYDYDDDDYGI
jgi:hypothetical protein